MVIRTGRRVGLFRRDVVRRTLFSIDADRSFAKRAINERDLRLVSSRETWGLVPETGTSLPIPRNQTNRSIYRIAAPKYALTRVGVDGRTAYFSMSIPVATRKTCAGIRVATGAEVSYFPLPDP